MTGKESAPSCSKDAEARPDETRKSGSPLRCGAIWPNGRTQKRPRPETILRKRDVRDAARWVRENKGLRDKCNEAVSRLAAQQRSSSLNSLGPLRRVAEALIPAALWTEFELRADIALKARSRSAEPRTRLCLL